MSVSARLRQYGAMRAIGMTSAQLVRMVAAEALTYVAGGMAALAVILTAMVLSAIAAVAGPARRIREMSVVDTLGSL